MTHKTVAQALLKQAIVATDNFLGIYKDAQKAGKATPQQVHDFTQQVSVAMEALKKFDAAEDHKPYIEEIMADMAKFMSDEDVSLYDEPYTHTPGASGEAESYEIEGDMIIDEAAETGLAAKAAKSGISIGTLRKVYSRGVAAWRTGHRPGTTPQQWGMARVNSYITKGKTYHTADKDLHEAEFASVKHDKESGLPQRYVSGVSSSTAKARAAHWEKTKKMATDDPAAYEPAPGDASAKTKESKYTKKFRDMFGEEKMSDEGTHPEPDEDDVDDLADQLEWEHIADTYEDDDFEKEDVKEEFLDEKLSAQARLKKRMTFARTSSKRQMAAAIKLRRPSTQSQLQKRATVAARRLLAKKFLKGRSKEQLSPQEKDILEERLRAMQKIQGLLAQRLIPKIKELERKRLKFKTK